MAFTHALNDTTQRPPKPELTWRVCDFCKGDGCANCDWHGGWWIIAADAYDRLAAQEGYDPQRAAATQRGVLWLNALALLCVIVYAVAA